MQSSASTIFGFLLQAFGLSASLASVDAGLFLLLFSLFLLGLILSPILISIILLIIGILLLLSLVILS